MKYTELYPINWTKQGDSTKEAVQKNRNELLHIANLMNNEQIFSNMRQAVLCAKVNGADYGYLVADRLTISIDASTIPVLVTFAAGFTDNGPVDHIVRITGKTAAWSLPQNNTSWLYIERSNVGAISYGSTTIEPVIQNNPPSARVNAHYFSPIEQRMRWYNGTQWVAVERLFVAKVVTNVDRASITYISSVEDEEIQRNVVAKIDTHKTAKTLDHPDLSVTTGKLANLSVTNDKLANKAVNASKIVDKTITEGQIADAVFTTVYKTVMLKVYPVGAIYISVNDVNPSTLFGGTWERLPAGRVLIGLGKASSGTLYLLGQQNGEERHILLAEEIPRHTHSGSVSVPDGSHYHAWGYHTNDNSGRFLSTGGSTRNYPLASGTGGAYWNGSRGGSNWGQSTSSLNLITSLNVNTGGSLTQGFKTSSYGGLAPHNNMQPYLVVNMWKRVK